MKRLLQKTGAGMAALLLLCCLLLPWLAPATAETVAQAPQFTAEEQAYIQNAGTITVGQIRNRFPISSLDETTSEMSGISEDILAKLSEMSGLTLVSQPVALDTKPLAALKAGTFDMVMGILNMDSFRADSEILLSQPYLTSTMAVVLPKGETFDPQKTYRVALKTSFQAMQEYISKNYPQFDLVYYSTDEECLDAILKGEAELLLQNVYVINYWLQKPKYEGLQILPNTFFSEQNCFAARSTADPLLISILDKCLASLTEQDIDEIVLANTYANPYRLTSADVLYKFRIPLAAIGLLTVVCLTLLGFYLRARQRSVRVIEGKNQELARQSGELEQKNRELSDAVNEAEHANSAKSQFLSRMSHEIRTPMNAIVGLTELAKNHEREPDKINEYLCKIETSSRVLLSIINDVLDMSAIESSKLKIAKSEFDIKQVLNGISTVYYTQCKNKGIEFLMGVDVSDEILLGDSLRLNQILMNLVSNAYKFTESGGKISIKVTQTGKKDGKVFLRFAVADTGCGMTPEMMDRLFKPFEQESATTAQKHGGSGLGMSIAKNLVDLMEGAIAVTSEKGKGTTFTVDLPFGATGGTTRSMDPERIKQMCALIVDDDATARSYTAVVVGRVGMQYEVAASGAQALEMLQKRRATGGKYDVCFTDWKMPDMNGVELARQIRRICGEETAIVMVSAYDISEAEDEARAAGASLFISKPLFQSSVFNALMQVTGGVVKQGKAAPVHYDFGGQRLLLAEDNELNTEIATELLGMVNMAVDHAANGAEAVAMAEKAAPGTYALILMDIQMPVMDGYEATAAIRASAREDLKKIPIFAMTANAFTEDVTHSLSAGMNGHIAKPIDTAVLYQTIYETLNP